MPAWPESSVITRRGSTCYRKRYPSSLARYRRSLLAGLALGFGIGFLRRHSFKLDPVVASPSERCRIGAPQHSLLDHDGRAFHLLMYAFAAIGLWLLWRSRTMRGDRDFVANLSVAIGLWQSWTPYLPLHSRYSLYSHGRGNSVVLGVL